VVLIGLAAKNAILIVEFAKQLQDQGKDRREAIVEACRVRLRPILMTSFAFILGVLPAAAQLSKEARMPYGSPHLSSSESKEDVWLGRSGRLRRARS
jgi:multidrug efflux pump subunit AcrB